MSVMLLALESWGASSHFKVLLPFLLDGKVLYSQPVVVLPCAVGLEAQPSLRRWPTIL